MIEEEWRPVVGYEGWYEVSNYGRVRNSAKRERTRPGKIIKPYLGGAGYEYVVLSVNAIPKKAIVHRMVAMSFIGLPKEGQHINHKDGSKRNNVPENLEWVSQAENNLHSWRALPHKINAVNGSRSPFAKLTEDIVLQIRTEPKSVTNMELARRYGVKDSAISKVRLRRSWTHI